MEHDTTTTGRLLILGLTLASVAVTAAAGMLTAYLAKKRTAANWAIVASWVWDLTLSVVAHMEATVRPAMGRALADGRLTASEAADIKRQALEALRQALGTEGIARLQAILGPGAITVYLSGMVERALGLQKALAAGAPAPASTLPPPPVLVPPTVAPVP